MAEQHAASMGKQNFFDHYAPSTSRSDPKLRKPKGPVSEPKESKETLETMQEMMDFPEGSTCSHWDSTHTCGFS